MNRQQLLILKELTQQCKLDANGKDADFYLTLVANCQAINKLYDELYGHVDGATTTFKNLLLSIIAAYQSRPNALLARDTQKTPNWFTSNQIVGMSLYVDRFCGTLQQLPQHLLYLQELGVNFLHLMPLMESPAGESDGGYAVSNFKAVDPRFGNLDNLIAVQKELQSKGMYLMQDIVLNHTSYKHEWAKKALAGDQHYQDYFYFFDNESDVKEWNQAMPEIFPESSPGSFTYITALKKWVMTVFHHYQWDLNFRNPHVLLSMLDNIFFYANIGVDILRIDAPAFIWKEKGTSCQNLDKAHTILRLIKLCVQTATPGMALLGEAIVAPKEIMKYFGTQEFTGKECDVAYGATNMALQWDALATGDVKVMLQAQPQINQKPKGTTWVSYTRCHDDIGLGYDDEMIAAAGYTPYDHRKYIKEFYSGLHPYSTASGALFSVNPKTQDARISGTLASLCGLEKALHHNKDSDIEKAIRKILLMQAQSILANGIPMLFYGDEVGYTNDYSYLADEAKNYDNRWMHRPIMDWNKNAKSSTVGTVEHTIFSGTQKLIAIRKRHEVFADNNNIEWLPAHNMHVAGFVRSTEKEKIVCLFNYSSQPAYLTWYALKEKGIRVAQKCLWTNENFELGNDDEFMQLQPYAVHILVRM